MINKAICCQCVLWLKSKIAKISTLKVKRIAKSLKFDPVNNSSLKVILPLHNVLHYRRSESKAASILFTSAVQFVSEGIT